MTTDEEVLEAAKERLGMCVDADDDVLPGIVFGLKFGVAYGCTDGWLWCVDHGEGVIAERTEMPNAGPQDLGAQALTYLADEPTRIYGLTVSVAGRMGGIARTQLGIFDLSRLSDYALGLVFGVEDDPSQDTVIELWTTERKGIPLVHLRYQNREASLAGCESGPWNPTYDLPLTEIAQ